MNGRPENRGSFPGKDKASAVAAGSNRNKAKLTAYLDLVPELRMHGAIPALPHTSLCVGPTGAHIGVPGVQQQDKHYHCDSHSHGPPLRKSDCN
jgi:hypothetical protein